MAQKSAQRGPSHLYSLAPSQSEWEKATRLIAALFPVLRGLDPQHPSFAKERFYILFQKIQPATSLVILGQ